MKNKQWMLRAVGVISALALGLGGLAACGNSSSAESKNGRVYYLNKKAEEQSTWVKLGKAFEKETGIPVQIQTGGTDYDATLRSELSKKAAPTMFQADGPSFMSSFKKYAKDLSNSDIYKQLDKNYKNRVLTNDEGKPIAIPYATESYGIIYNKALLKKYFDASWSTVKSAEDINNFKALKTVADEIQAHKDEIGVKGAFSSAGLDSSSAFRYNFHLPSVPLYYEYADDGVDMTKVPSSVKGTYVKKMKNIFDLYIKDSTVEPSSLSGKTMDDSIAEFATGKAVFFQDGVWAYNQIKGQSVSDNNLGVFPIYIGAKGEENQGLNQVISNYWCVNSKVSEKDQQATEKFLSWLVTSDTALKAISQDMGLVSPFKGFDNEKYQVTNPLVGDNGASRIFGPQKGASEAMIVELDNNLSHYADVIKKALHVDVKDVPGAGAAGGMGAALMAFLGAELKSGIEIVTTALNLEEHIHDCTLVITGEGRIDSQSIHGKVPIGVANVAKKYHKPVIGIAGSLTNDVGVVHQHGIDAVFSVLTSIGTLDEAFRGAYDNIYRASRNIAATLAIGMRNVG